MGLRPLNGAPDATRPGAEATGLAAARRRAGGRPTGVIPPRRGRGARGGGRPMALAASCGRGRPAAPRRRGARRAAMGCGLTARRRRNRCGRLARTCGTAATSGRRCRTGGADAHRRTDRRPVGRTVAVSPRERRITRTVVQGRSCAAIGDPLHFLRRPTSTEAAREAGLPDLARRCGRRSARVRSTPGPRHPANRPREASGASPSAGLKARRRRARCAGCAACRGRSPARPARGSLAAPCPRPRRCRRRCTRSAGTARRGPAPRS